MAIITIDIPDNLALKLDNLKNIHEKIYSSFSDKKKKKYAKVQNFYIAVLSVGAQAYLDKLIELKVVEVRK